MSKKVIFCFYLLHVVFFTISIFGQTNQTESFLVYGQGVEETVSMRIMEPISIYVTVKGDDILGFSLRDNIAGFSLRNNVLITFSSIELTSSDFNVFKSALEKALEWDIIARQNDVNSFSRNIPFTISSNNISWITFIDREKHTIKRGETLTLEFTFSWTPGLIEERSRAALSINSNIVNTSVSGSKETFRFSKMNIHRGEIELLLEKITDEKIREAINVGRIRQIEDEARARRTETLFN